MRIRNAPDRIIKRPAFRYFGGKFSLASWIISHFPAHHLYCEGFGGAANVLLRKTPATVEIFNDTNDEVINFFECLRNHETELIRLLDLTPYARQEMNNARQPAEDKLERARRFYVLSSMSFNSSNVDYNSGWKFNRTPESKKNEAKVFQKLSHLPLVKARLKDVQIEHDDIFKILERFDSKDALHYLDPPYMAEARCRQWRHTAYKNEFPKEKHEQLLDVANDLEGAVVISGYSTPLYEQKLAHWQRVEKDARTTAANKIEVLWIKQKK